MAAEAARAETATARDDLAARIAAQPRIRLTHLPTPLDPCPRLAEAIGVRALHIKRDDLTGLAFGGNKTRHLEFTFADILQSGADTVVAGAYTQSNWCRQITAAARSISPIRWEEERALDIARLATATARALDLNLAIAPADFVADEDYAGERYGLLTPEARAAVRLTAETEGILLDPVYTGKAMAGLIDYAKRGAVGAGETVVFVHTGGLPLIFAYAGELTEGR